MRLLDRYILRQILAPFLFFVLVFTGVIWLTQSLRVIDTVVNNGQSAGVFLQFTALLLPMVLSIVLPISLFAAVLYTINRLFSDSEIVVMMATGLSGMSITRAVVVFGLAVMAIVYLLTLYLMPLAQSEMRDRVTQIRGDVAVAFMREGAFLTPTSGVTVYLRETSASGELLGVFVQDERDAGQEMTYSARRAILIRDDAETRLLMFDGMAQRMRGSGAGGLAVLHFDQLSYDLTSFASSASERPRKPSEMYLPELLSISGEEEGSRRLAEYRAEAHEALSAPLYTLTLPLIAVASIVGAGFRRQGFTRRIVLAASAGLAVRVAGLAAKSIVTGAGALWPLIYVPPLLGILVSLWMLSGVQLLPRRRKEIA